MGVGGVGGDQERATRTHIYTITDGAARSLPESQPSVWIVEGSPGHVQAQFANHHHNQKSQLGVLNHKGLLKLIFSAAASFCWKKADMQVIS